MTWSPIKMRWPTQATQWMDGLGDAKGLAETELASTVMRLAKLEGIATTTPGPVGAAAGAAITAGREAMAAQLGEVPACLAVTPFQPGVGQGRGNLRFLAAPNLVQCLADKLVDPSATASAEQHALIILFLATGHEQLAASLERFNALLPVPDMVRCANRSRQLSRLESEKWILPVSRPLPHWGTLPLERCTITKAAQQALSGQIAVLEGYAADSSPLADLGRLATKKAAQSRAKDEQLRALQEQLANPTEETSIVAQMIGPGTTAHLRRQLLSEQAPSHQWVLSAGLMLLGTESGLSFVQELVGL